MFNFFSKKRFLVDMLEGFVDMHNHILPCIDDGAKTIEESIELLGGFSQFGVKRFICTPHIMKDLYDNDKSTIKTSFDKLESALPKNDLYDISIDYAAEHLIDGHFEDLIHAKGILPIKNKFVLVETSFLQKPLNFERVVEKLNSEKFVPVLAHPERYMFLGNNYDKWARQKDKTIKYQANLLSLSEFYSPEVKSTLLRLIDDDCIDYLASDVHNQRQLDVLKEIQLPIKMTDKILSLINNTIYDFH